MKPETIIQFRKPVSIQQMSCTVCGAQADASCNCGAPYLPAKKRAADAVAANPEKSNRAIASDIGVSDMTVGRARKEGATDVAPEMRIGKDGKSYPATRQPAEDHPESDEDYPDFLTPSEADRGITYIANRVNSGLFVPSPGILQCLKDAMPRASASDREALVTAKEFLSHLLED